MKNIKLFIWDFDGTLMNTYPNLTGYMQRALLEVGHNVSHVEILEQMLDNIGQAVKFFSEKFEIEDLSERFDKYYTAGIDDPAELFDGVVNVLQAIRDRGAKNLIFTNRGDSIFPMLEEKGIAHLFDEVVTSTHPNFAWKPAPDAIFYLMEKYGGTTENTVMIGDRVCDLGSAWNAGCKTCHLLTPAVPQYPPCDWRIRNFAEMLTLLK